MSSFNKVVIDNPKDFQNEILNYENQANQDNKELYLVFSGDTNPDTGLSWCPDCVVGMPIIERVLSERNSLMVYIPVIRSEYKSSDYYYRVLPSISLKCVPTLIKWKNGKIFARLNDIQSQNEVSSCLNSVCIIILTFLWSRN